MFKWFFDMTVPAAQRTMSGAISPGMLDVTSQILQAASQQGATLDPARLRCALDRVEVLLPQPGDLCPDGSPAANDPNARGRHYGWQDGPGGPGQQGYLSAGFSSQVGCGATRYLVCTMVTAPTRVAGWVIQPDEATATPRMA